MWLDRVSYMLRSSLHVMAAFAVILIGSRPASATTSFDYCSIGQSTSIFMIDRTTRFDNTDEQILVSQVETFYRDQRPGERVLVVAVTGAYTEMRVAFNQCRPGCPEEALLARLVSACRPVVARSDLLAFERSFIAVVRELLRNQEEASASDLFRSVSEITRSVEANRYRPLRQMLIYTDLLEASQIFPGTTFRRTPPEAVLRRLNAERIEAKLARTSVRVVGFGRDDAPNRAALAPDMRRRIEESWRQWLTAGGASEVQIGLR